MTDSFKIAPLPENEAERVAALRHYDILDSQAEVAFDRITRMAAKRFNVPIALVSLVDADRQWFKSRYGLEAVETPRDVAFCSHAILGNDVFIVNDATTDLRFQGNPLVTDSPNVCFYAGAPLKNRDGYNLGTLCIIDHSPHPEFSHQNAHELAELAEIAMDEIELRYAARRTRRDLDGIKALQSSLEQKRERSEAAMREKAEFLANISHELRTPMNGILGMAYLLRDTRLDSTQRSYVETINHSAENLLLLINDVLDLSKIEAKELILDKRAFDIRNSFTQTIKILLPLAGKKGIDVIYEIDANVPEVIIGDQGRFAQIVTNLVGNAIKFTHKGKVEARLQYDASTGFISCTVTDTGIGIPEDKHKAIFEKFVQGDAAITREYGGTGLGLAITKQLTVMLGGSIGFESKPGVGSKFWFKIPAQVADNAGAGEQAIKPAPQSIVQLPHVSKMRALIAEDHPVNQVFLATLLRKFGFLSIDITENGLEAMDKITHSQGYDIIFMDCKMPLQDGYETTRLIRAHESMAGRARTPIIAMTANALSGDREECFNAGMDEYLSKPIEPDLLKDALGRWLSFEDSVNIVINGSGEKQAPLSMERLDLVADSPQSKAMLINLFFRTSDSLVSTLEKSRRSSEAVHWKEAAHSLKGSAANLGMHNLEDLCRQAEHAMNADYNMLTSLLEQIKHELERIKAFIAQEGIYDDTVIIKERTNVAR